MESDIEDRHNEAVRVANAMINYGGGFVQQLGRTLARADPVNTIKIKQTWPEHWLRYKNMADVIEAQKKRERKSHADSS